MGDAFSSCIKSASNDSGFEAPGVGALDQVQEEVGDSLDEIMQFGEAEFGFSVAGEILEAVPVVKDVIQAVRKIWNKVKEYEDMKEWVRRLLEDVGQIAQQAAKLAQGEDRTRLEEALFEASERIYATGTLAAVMDAAALKKNLKAIKDHLHQRSSFAALNQLTGQLIVDQNVLPGARVMAKGDMFSIDDEEYHIKAGMTGLVKSVDSSGDALIFFETADTSTNKWVSADNVKLFQVIETPPEACEGQLLHFPDGSTQTAHEFVVALRAKGFSLETALEAMQALRRNQGAWAEKAEEKSHSSQVHDAAGWQLYNEALEELREAGFEIEGAKQVGAPSTSTVSDGNKKQQQKKCCTVM